MKELLDGVYNLIERWSPYIVGGMIGAIIHRIRNNMSWVQFLGSIVISIFIALSVGILCKDYFEIKKDTVIFVLCGISGTFSKVILDEIEETLKNSSEIIKKKILGKDE